MNTRTFKKRIKETMKHPDSLRDILNDLRAAPKHRAAGAIIDAELAIIAKFKGLLPERYQMKAPPPPCPACGAKEGAYHTDCPIEKAQKTTMVAHNAVLDQITKSLEEWR